MDKAKTYSRKEFNSEFSKSMSHQHFDSRLRTPASDFLYTIVNMYPDLIDKNKIKELIETHIFMFQSKEENRYLEGKDGYWLKQSIEDTSVEDNFGGLRLNNNLLEKSQEKSAIICHELLHMCSQNMEYVQFGGFYFESFGFYMNQASYIQGESELGYRSGQFLNEGFTEYLTEEVTRNCTGYKTFVTPNDSFYKPLVGIAKVLHAAGGDKVLEAYFKGDSTIMINEFDEISGSGAWKQFLDSVDCIAYEPKRKREGVTVEQAVTKSKALIYEYYFNKDEKSFNEFFSKNEIIPWIKRECSKGKREANQEKSEARAKDLLALIPKQSEKKDGVKKILKDYLKSNLKKETLNKSIRTFNTRGNVEKNSEVLK